METMQKWLLVLTVVGAINWGLIGIFNLNLVTLFFGESLLTRLTYIIIGACGVVNIGILFNHISAE